jgi:hypothetical protein
MRKRRILTVVGLAAVPVVLAGFLPLAPHVLLALAFFLLLSSQGSPSSILLFLGVLLVTLFVFFPGGNLIPL